MNHSDSMDAIFKALESAKKEFAPVVRDKDNPFFKSKYADLKSCIDATEPALVKNGLMILQFPVSDANGVGVETILVHVPSSQYISNQFSLPLSKDDAQAGTAAITYARRTARLAILDIATQEDDDGETAVGRGKFERKEAKKSATKKSEAPSTPPVEVSGAAEKKAGEPTSSVSSALPTPEAFQTYRERGKALANNLKLWGMKGDTLQKLGKYFLVGSNAPSLDKLTTIQWDTLFGAVDALQGTTDGGTKIVALIEAKVKEAKS